MESSKGIVYCFFAVLNREERFLLFSSALIEMGCIIDL